MQIWSKYAFVVGAVAVLAVVGLFVTAAIRPKRARGERRGRRHGLPGTAAAGESEDNPDAVAVALTPERPGL